MIDPQLAQLAISLIDLTDLTNDCRPKSIDALCERAITHGTAAVCVWPDFVAQSASLLADSPVLVATVVNFPSGSERPSAVGVLTSQALADGADEIDVVLPFRQFAAGDFGRAANMLDTVRSLTEGSATMKVILETGELPDLETVDGAARFAVDHGADFIKTSTGKSPVSATLEAAEVMLRVIKQTDRQVGIKPSGGISTADDAARYIELAERIMGERWVTPSTFRFGASGLLNALIAVLNDESAVAAATQSDY
jgi:deoxyribose-phosphate aldolase